MDFVLLTRPDDSLIAIKIEEIVHFAPVPSSGPLQGLLPTGTRIVFKNQTHQDVIELVDDVLAAIRSA
ncbi:hypothetical protein [Rhizobium sp. PP-CC-3G-465]|uniref:hypothetical protein n=1 Tax=Rhizobium sp. PP-CC-3G-465 TaxID=2135648 RepID=UPI00104D4DDB|nr:hypothetical protein C8J33_11632 [Rhizobium sp. PP-CC-3G-465]